MQQDLSRDFEFYLKLLPECYILLGFLLFAIGDYCHLEYDPLAIFQQRWRLAHASSFVDRLAHIARGRPRRTLCRASELPGGRDYASRDS